MTAQSRGVAAALPAAQTALGVVLVAAPDRVGRALTGPRGSVPPRWIVRVLGGRLIVQGAVLLARPTPALELGSAGVDATHAASMLALAAATARYRRTALLSAAAAIASATASAVTARAGLDARTAQR